MPTAAVRAATTGGPSGGPEEIDERRKRSGILDAVSGIIATARLCAVLGAHGLAIRVSQEVDVDCCGDELVFRDRVQACAPYAKICVLDGDGSGVRQRGMGVIGGGSGPEGAAGGMLVDTVPDPSTTGAHNDLVVRLSTRGAELYPHTSCEPPDSQETEGPC
jgi:hypothetical protein